MNNPRYIGTSSTVAPSKNEPTVSPLCGSTSTVETTGTSQQQLQEKDGSPLIKKPKLTASHESLNSTASSGPQVSVHSSSEKQGQYSDTHLHAKKPKFTASHESLNSTTSSDQRISVHSGGWGWGQQDTVDNLYDTQKPKLTASHGSLNSASSSGQQSSIYGEGLRQQESESRPCTNSELTLSHESLDSKSGQQPSAHARLSECALKIPSTSHTVQKQHLVLTSAREVTKTPAEGVAADVTPGLASVSIGMPDTGSEVKHPLRHINNQASILPSSPMSSSVKLEEDKTSNIDELNDLDRTTPTEERVPLPSATVGIPSVVRGNAEGDVKYQPMVDEWSQQQQQQIGDDEPHFKGGLMKAPLPSPIDWQGSNCLCNITVL